MAEVRSTPTDGDTADAEDESLGIKVVGREVAGWMCMTAVDKRSGVEVGMIEPSIPQDVRMNTVCPDSPFN